MNNSQKTRSERRRKEQEARRKAILKSAREVFFRKGFMDATVDEIAERSGLAKGTIYLYFGSKEEIYMSLMAEGMKLLRKELEQLRNLEARDGGLVERALTAYYGFYRKNRKYFRIMFLSSQPDLRARVPDELLRSCMETGRECLGIVRDVVRKGIEAGMYRKVDPWAVANVLWATVNGIIMSYEQDIYREEIAGLELETMLNEGLDLVMGGLRVKR
jgi:AcrR family transcriptional regulator